MKWNNYEVSGMFIAVLISSSVTAVFSILGDKWFIIPTLPLYIIIGYSHRPKRLATNKTEADIG